MSTYPTTPRSAFLQWAQAHESVFVTNAVNIGLTAAQATAFKTATDALAAAMLAQESARQAAKVATQAADDAFQTARSSAGDTVRTIRAFAENSAKPLTVYNLAQIPPPSSPTPTPPPDQPTNLQVVLDAAMGTHTLRWKAVNPASGTSYIIKRRLPGETEFSFIGVSGKKTFVDDTLIAGPDSVQYTVQGQRADSSGPVSEIFTVNFGQLPGGGRTATVVEGNSAAMTSDQAVVDAIVNSKPQGNGQMRREKARK